MSFTDLPVVNAGLNGLSVVWLTAGFGFIKRGRKIAHRNCMIAALVTSTLFLACYLIYHYQMKQAYGKHTPGFWSRPGFVQYTSWFCSPTCLVHLPSCRWSS